MAHAESGSRVFTEATSATLTTLAAETTSSYGDVSSARDRCEECYSSGTGIEGYPCTLCKKGPTMLNNASYGSVSGESSWVRPEESLGSQSFPSTSGDHSSAELSPSRRPPGPADGDTERPQENVIKPVEGGSLPNLLPAGHIGTTARGNGGIWNMTPRSNTTARSDDGSTISRRRSQSERRTLPGESLTHDRATGYMTTLDGDRRTSPGETLPYDKISGRADRRNTTRIRNEIETDYVRSCSRSPPVRSSRPSSESALLRTPVPKLDLSIQGHDKLETEPAGAPPAVPVETFTTG